MADVDEAEQPSAEPVRVAALTDTQERAARALKALRSELGGRVVTDQAGLNAFAAQVATRVLGYRQAGLADPLLVGLLIEHLCGVGTKACVTVPDALLSERMASHS